MYGTWFFFSSSKFSLPTQRQFYSHIQRSKPIVHHLLTSILPFGCIFRIITKNKSYKSFEVIRSPSIFTFSTENTVQFLINIHHITILFLKIMFSHFHFFYPSRCTDEKKTCPEMLWFFSHFREEVKFFRYFFPSNISLVTIHRMILLKKRIYFWARLWICFFVSWQFVAPGWFVNERVKKMEFQSGHSLIDEKRDSNSCNWFLI